MFTVLLLFYNSFQSFHIVAKFFLFYRSISPVNPVENPCFHPSKPLSTSIDSHFNHTWAFLTSQWQTYPNTFHSNTNTFLFKLNNTMHYETPCTIVQIDVLTSTFVFGLWITSLFGAFNKQGWLWFRYGYKIH